MRLQIVMKIQMVNRHLLIWLILLPLCTTGQNLVKNPGFEDNTKHIPAGLNFLGRQGQGTEIVNHWFAPARGTPEIYFREDVTLIEPAGGYGMGGITAHKSVLGLKTHKGKEYFSGRLSEPLEAGKAYCVCADVALHRTSKWSVTNLGFQFQQQPSNRIKRRKTRKSEAHIYMDRSRHIANQDWRSYCTTYIAEGGETGFLFGSFGKKNKPKRIKKLGVERFDQRDVYTARAYYMVDNFTVKPMVTGQCGCAGTLQESGSRNTTTMVLDVSSSMRELGVFDSLSSRVEDWVELMDSSHRLNIVQFASHPELLYQGTRGDLSPDSLSHLLGRLKMSGGTDVYKGLSEGYKRTLEILPASEDSANVVLITDGRFAIDDRMIQMVRHHHDQHNALLTVIHLNNKAEDIDKLKGMGVNYHTAKERNFNLILTNLYAPSGDAVACKCDPITLQHLPISYTFVLDYSGSMGSKNRNFKKHFDYCLTQLPDTAHLSIMSFNTEAKIEFTGTKRKLLDMGAHHFTAPYNIEGGTSVNAGLSEAYRYLTSKAASPKHQHRVILLSDHHPGQVREKAALFEMMDDHFREYNIGVRGVDIGIIRDMYYEYQPLNNSIKEIKAKTICEQGRAWEEEVQCGYRTQRYTGPHKPTHAVKTVFFLIVGTVGTQSAIIAATIAAIRN